MSRIAVIPGSLNDLESVIKNKDVSEIILGVSNLSIYPFTLSIDDIINISNKTDKIITISLNKMIHNKDLDLIRDILIKVNTSNIKKILFYDLGIFNMCKNLGINKELVLHQEHLNASISSNNFYYKRGITSSFITSDITYEEINDIKNNTKMNIYYTIYGYLPIFYSRRLLLTNYFKYIDKPIMDNKYYVFHNDLKYMIKEFDFGTIIYSPLVDITSSLDKIKNLDTFVIDLSYNNNLSILNDIGGNLANKKKENCYKGFFENKCTYKLRSDN